MLVFRIVVESSPECVGSQNSSRMESRMCWYLE